jgi:hypothetical protein
MIDIDDALHTAAAGQDFIFVNHSEWFEWIVNDV